MKCAYHHDAEAQHQCQDCNRPLCGQCSIEVGANHYCRGCLEKRIPAKEKKPCGNRSVFWTFLFSLVPGVGYLYLGLMKRGLQTMLIFFGSIFLTDLVGFGSLMALVAPVVMFYSIFDAQQLVREINRGNYVEDKEIFDLNIFEGRRTWVGYGLIAVGGLALFNNLIYLLPGINDWMIRRVTAPLIILALGIYILYRNTRKAS